MKKGILFIALLLILAFSQAARAQTTAFTYQGSLNFNGAPANGNFDFEFALFNHPSEDSQIGTTITLTNVAVTNGVFSVNLNFGDQFPSFIRLLEIRVRPAGSGAAFTALTPRQQITSVPYAIKSLNASNAINANTANTATNALQLGGFAAGEFIRQGNDTITAGTQFNIGNTRVLSVPGFNTFTGRNTGTSNTGSSNSFFGFSSGQSNTSGSFNSIFGSFAGRQNTTGDDNSFFGASAGTSNTAGERNSFFGMFAGSANTDGFNNSFFGQRAGADNTNGINNSFFGTGTGDSNTTGSRNAFFGAFAGDTLTNASSVSLFGGNSSAVDGIVNATAIGFRAFVGQSNSLVLGSIDGVNGSTADTFVGIGTPTPTHRLTIGQPETPLNPGAKFAIYGADLADIILRDTTADAEGVFSANGPRVVIGALSNSELQFRTNNTGRMTIAPTGEVAINVLGAAGATQLCRNASNQIATCSSSKRYKSNINLFSSGLSLIRKLRPVAFDWKQGGMRDLGLVAEEVAGVEPLLVTKNEQGETEGVKYDRVGVVLINAVQEQQAQIEAQQKQLNEQKETIRRQEDQLMKQQTELKALKQLVCSQNPSAEICRTKN